MNARLIDEFRHPPSEYRGAPFWAWNGKLEGEELRRQIRQMYHMGLGGFFMHSRVGLDTAYLSNEWFRCISVCIDEAEKLDMQAWLYDEDRWPSGAAGGLVTKNPKYRMRSLAMDVLDTPNDLRWTDETLAVFTGRLDGTTARNVKRLKKGARPKTLARGEKLLVFSYEVQGCSSWYNGYTYLDTLSHEAVRKFIQVTHEAYKKRYGDILGKRVPGIFTDEPNYSKKRPWTATLPATFRKRYGFDLIAHLPEVFFDVEGHSSARTRWCYYDCATFLFVDAFSRQIGQWCERAGMQHTGHVLLEATPSSQTSRVGSCMRFYEYMHTPGMDVLTEFWREYDTAKQVSSVARQFGRKWRVTETYGCTGWDFSFAGHKAVGDWQVALGINLRCQHLSWYTMEGQAKRDYPAGIFYQSPWWELYPKVEDYFARIHAVMTKGVEVRDLLVIHPLESTWLLTKEGWLADPAVAALDTSLMQLRDSLLSGNIDFDYGDEDILARHARIGRAAGQPIIKVVKGAYKAVVVPPTRTIRRSTLQLLRRFAKAGGRVVFAGPAPQLVDAEPCGCAATFAKTCAKAPPKGAALVKAVESAVRRVTITDGAGRNIPETLHLLREDTEAYYLFVCNTSHPMGTARALPVRDRKAAYDDVRICGFADCAGSPVELDPDTGEIYAASARRAKGGWQIRTSLPAIGSRMFVIPKKKRRKTYQPRPKLKDIRSQTLTGRKWDVTLSQNNVLVLDRPRYRIADGRWRKADEILRVDHAVRDALGIARRGGSMVQPWARVRPDRPKQIIVTLAYQFDVKTLPSGEMHLGIERPDTFLVAVNGADVTTEGQCGWWCDRSLRRVPVDPSLLRLGRNEIVLTCCYDETHPGLEIVYLLGTFGAKVKGTDITMTAAPAALRLGDWVKQGLAFYAGNVSYRRSIRPKLRKTQRLFVQVPAYRGTAVRVLAGGQVAGVIAWEPNEVEITDMVKPGEALDLRIEVIGHRRNSHGPLHMTNRWPVWHGPGTFATTGKGWTDGYNLVPCGLMAAPRLVVRR